MDSFEFDNVKAEKAHALRRYRVLRNMAVVLRAVELCLALFFVSQIPTRIPFAVRISGKFLRELYVLIASPLFVFVVCNAIIITLLVKSGQLSGQNHGLDNADSDLRQEILQNSENRAENRPEKPTVEHEPEEIVYEDKQVVSEVSTPPAPDYKDSPAADPVAHAKVYHRSQSENPKRESSENPCGTLRRSETEKCWKTVSCCDDPPEALYPEDELSNEEFRGIIEAFIAKQLKFHRDESLSIVLRNHS